MTHAVRGRTRYPGTIDPRLRRTFLPTQIAGCTLWLAADRITGLDDNDRLAQWDDLSGSGYHFSQATADYQPLYKTGVVNGLPVLRFDGSNDDLGASGLDPGSDVTLFMVLKPVSTTPIGLLDSAPSSMNALRNFSAGQLEWWENAPIFNLGLPNTNPILLAFVCSLNPTRRIEYHRAGAYVGAYTNASTAAMAWNGPRIGSINTRTAGCYAGDIAEVIIYGSTLASADLQSVSDYLSAKWGI